MYALVLPMMYCTEYLFIPTGSPTPRPDGEVRKKTNKIACGKRDVEIIPSSAKTPQKKLGFKGAVHLFSPKVQSDAAL